MIEHPDCGGEATTDGSVKCRVVGREDSDNLRWDRIVQEGSSIGGIEWECWMVRLGGAGVLGTFTPWCLA